MTLLYEPKISINEVHPHTKNELSRSRILTDRCNQYYGFAVVNQSPIDHLLYLVQLITSRFQMASTVWDKLHHCADVNERDTDIVPLYEATSTQKDSRIAHTVKGSPTRRSSMIGMSRMPLPSQPKLVLIYQPERDGKLSSPRHMTMSKQSAQYYYVTYIRVASCSNRHASPGNLRLMASWAASHDSNHWATPNVILRILPHTKRT